MSQYQLNPDFFDKPVGLSEEQLKNPIVVIKDFFADYRLSELRNIQDQIQKVCLTSDEGSFNQSEERSNLIYYNERLICLLEAAYHLRETVPSPDNVVRPEPATAERSTAMDNYKRVAELVKGINDLNVDLANLCLLVVNAWTEKAFSALKIARSSGKKAPSTAPAPSLDLDKLHSMALALQNKLVKLADCAVDLLIKEIHNTIELPIYRPQAKENSTS